MGKPDRQPTIRCKAPLFFISSYGDVWWGSYMKVLFWNGGFSPHQTQFLHSSQSMQLPKVFVIQLRTFNKNHPPYVQEHFQFSIKTQLGQRIVYLSLKITFLLSPYSPNSWRPFQISFASSLHQQSPGPVFRYTPSLFSFEKQLFCD